MHAKQQEATAKGRQQTHHENPRIDKLECTTVRNTLSTSKQAIQRGSQPVNKEVNERVTNQRQEHSGIHNTAPTTATASSTITSCNHIVNIH